MLSSIGIRRVRLAIVGLIMMAATPWAHAAQFGVRVVDVNGNPVEGAAVCIGLEGNYRQFGAMFTTRDGVAMTEVPNVPLIVTVSTDRFSGLRLNQPARGFNLIREVRLVKGVPGPRCRAGSSVADARESGAIEIAAYRVDESGFRLTPTTSGAPNQYRIGSRADFEGVSWQPLGGTITVPSSIRNAEAWYLQVRRFSGSAKASLEIRSEPIRINRSATALN